METAQSLFIIDCHTDLTVSILNDCFFMCKEMSMTGRNFPFIFWYKEYPEIKSREFSDFVPVSGEEYRSFLEVTVRKIDSVLLELTIGEEST